MSGERPDPDLSSQPDTVYVPRNRAERLHKSPAITTSGNVRELRVPRLRRKDLEYGNAVEVMDSLVDIARQAGEEILSSKVVIRDEGTVSGHETSSIDSVARNIVDNLLNEKLPHIDGVRRFELHPYERRLLMAAERGTLRGFFIIDEIDGTTNTKRAMASPFRYRPQAGVSIAFSPTEQMGDIQTVALYLLNDQETFSALRIGDRYQAFHEGRLIRPTEIEATPGDSAQRVLVVGYSNSHRLEKAEIEDVLVRERGIRPYDGTRSSSVDIINVIRGQYDAYIDLRALWGGDTRTEARLEAYDVAAAIPIALGAGLTASDGFGDSWKKYNGMLPLTLVVARPKLHSKILETISPVVARQNGVQVWPQSN